jgi:hypothetical protein
MWTFLNEFCFIRISPLTKGTIGTHGDSNCLLENFITKDNKYVVNEEPQYLFNVNLRVLVLGVRVVDNKMRT